MEIAKTYMSKPITINYASNLVEVLKKIIDENKSRLLVEKDYRISKIVSEKDLGLFLFSDTSGRKLGQISLSDISKEIISVNEFTNLDECARKILDLEIGSLAISSDDNVIGILTKTDLVKYFSAAYLGKKTVGEYMTPYYAWEYSDSSISYVVSKMIEKKISRIILRNKSEIPDGIITFRDLFKISLKLGQEDEVLDNSDSMISVIFPRKGFVSKSGFGEATKAFEIMTKNILSVNYDDDLAKTGKLLNNKQVNGAGVLSRNGNLIGMISKTDIVKALAFMK